MVSILPELLGAEAWLPSAVEGGSARDGHSRNVLRAIQHDRRRTETQGRIIVILHCAACQTKRKIIFVKVRSLREMRV